MDVSNITEILKLTGDKLTRDECLNIGRSSTIQLSEKNLNDQDIEHLVPLFKSNQNARTLDISKNLLTQHSISILVTHLPLLTSLYASCNRLVRSMDNICKFSKLKVLDISYNQLSKYDTRFIKDFKSLEILNLTFNNIRDSEIEDISSIPKIRILNLSHNDITDEGAKILASIKTLTELNLSYNPITSVGRDALKEISTLKLNGTYCDRNYIPLKRLKELIPIPTNIKDSDVTFPEPYEIPSRGEEPMELIDQTPAGSDSQMVNASQEFFTILSIDGGGIRGIIPAMVLKHIQERVKERLTREGQGHDFHLSSVFDLMAGTSTGGIISLGLTTPGENNKPLLDIEDLVQLYKNDGPLMFQKRAFWSIFGITHLFDYKYNPGGLEKRLEELVGDAKLSESLTGVHIVSYDMKKDSICSFTSHEAKEGDDNNYYVKDIARATSAAPTYFPAAEIKSMDHKHARLLIDGGVIANNPCYHAFEDAKVNYSPAKKYFILSLGTGEGLTEIDYHKLKSAGQLGWASKISDHLMRNNEMNIERFMKYVSSMDPSIEYHRFQLDLPTEMRPMDNATPQNIEKLEKVSKRFIKANIKELERIVDALVRRYKMTHQRRIT